MWSCTASTEGSYTFTFTNDEGCPAEVNYTVSEAPAPTSTPISTPTVTPTEPPDYCTDPRGFSASKEDLSCHSVRLDWSQPKNNDWGDENGDACEFTPNNPIGGCDGNRRYVVRILQGGETIRSLDCTADRSLVITGLDPSTVYEYRIWAVNACNCDSRLTASFTTVACPTGTPTETPVPTATPTEPETPTATPAPYCEWIGLFDEDWQQIMLPDEVSSIVPGETYYFAVYGLDGSFDRARFWIDALGLDLGTDWCTELGETVVVGDWCETARAHSLGGFDVFYVTLVFPEGVYDYHVRGQVCVEGTGDCVPSYQQPI